MTSKLYFGGAAILAAAIALTGASKSDYKLEDRQTVNHTFGNDKTIDVDLVNGGVTVIGDGGTSIRITGEHIVRANTQAEIDRGKKDDVLDMNEKDGVAQIYENGPFRNGGNSSHSSDNHGFHEGSDRDHEYNVEWNITAHVPRAIALKLRSVNGTVNAQDTAGTYDVHCVNGQITMTGISGSGTVSSVNGTDTVTFRENPKSDSSFTSVNGKIDLSFQPNLSADFDLHTVNGGMFTDFESMALGSTGSASQQNGKYVYRSRGESRVHIGAAGGPQIKVQTVNGSIEIRKVSK
jgi:hypothetical protein